MRLLVFSFGRNMCLLVDNVVTGGRVESLMYESESRK